MQTLSRLLAFICCAATVVSATAQSARPDFSGTWRLESSSVPSANFDGVAGGGLELAIVQTPSAITFTRAYGRGQASIRLTLDAKETTLDDPMTHRPGITVRRVAKASFEPGGKLSIVTISRIRDDKEGFERTVETKETLSLDRTILIVERTSTGQVAQPAERYRK